MKLYAILSRGWYKSTELGLNQIEEFIEQINSLIDKLVN